VDEIHLITQGENYPHTPQKGPQHNRAQGPITKFINILEQPIILTINN